MEYALLEPTGFFDELIAKARVRRIRFHPAAHLRVPPTCAERASANGDGDAWGTRSSP
jgi:hypothetical protein